ncbi:MAG: hypothetical protein DCC49_09275 [Acidobacteria bacterium]|nr:MAG: hypothetical protein DCC49_09275 [Acidobacteriota bacterium]
MQTDLAPLLRQMTMSQTQYPLAQGPRTELARALERAAATSQAFQYAMDEMSNLYGYAYWKALNSVAGTALLRQVAAAQGLLTPEIDRQFATMTQNYLRDIDGARYAASHHLLQLANDIAAGQVSPDSLRDRLNRLLQG